VFRRWCGNETNLAGDETILRGGADVPKQGAAIDLLTTQQTALLTGDRQMRTLSFILAFAFILTGPSMAGLVDNSLPGIGAFSYNGSQSNPVPPAMIIAAR
jgi:hypothetical protein